MRHHPPLRSGAHNPAQPIEHFAQIVLSLGCIFLHQDQVGSYKVTYPLLRVEIQEVEIERMRGFPPRLLRPASIKPFNLDIDGHLSPSRTPKATHLAKFASHIAVGALQSRGG